MSTIINMYDRGQRQKKFPHVMRQPSYYKVRSHFNMFAERVCINNPLFTPKDVLIHALSEIRDYATSLGVNWEELDYRSSMPKDDVEKVCIGKVVYSSKKPENPFGFLQDGTFFHRTRGGVFVCDGSELPVFKGETIPLPKPGEMVVYKKVDGRKGPMADWWALESSYKAAEVLCANRLEYRLFRYGSNIARFRSMAT